MIYLQEGTEPQLDAFLEMADRQLTAMEHQRAEIDTSITDLRILRETAVEELKRMK